MKHRLWLSLCFVWVALTSQAMAACPQGQEAFTSCQIEGRNTEVFVCFNDQVATYSYGPLGGPPDLFLSEAIDRVDFEPWSGLGTAISETVTFYKHDYGYEVSGGFERPFSDEEAERPQRRFGEVEVTESGVPAARLECIPETVTYGFGGGLYDAKVAAGQTWDEDSMTWVSDLGQSESPTLLRETQQYGEVFDCLPASEFNLNGAKMSDTIDALSKLGTPEATDDTSFSDEPIDRIALIGANIDFYRDELVTMSTTSPDWRMPSGLKVSLTRGDVIHILGRVPGGYTARSQNFTVPVCPENQHASRDIAYSKWLALFEFGQDKRVDRIIFVTPTE